MKVSDAIKDKTIERFYLKSGGSPIYDLEPFMNCNGEIDYDEKDFGANYGCSGYARVKIFKIDPRKINKELLVKKLKQSAYIRDGAYRVDIEYLSTLLELFLGE